MAGKSKEIQAAKKAAKTATEGKGGSDGGKGKKKKWSKGRVKEKVSNKVLLDKKAHTSMLKDLPKMKLITISKVSDQLGVVGSVARQCIRHMSEKGLIKPVIVHSKMLIFAPTAEESTEAADKKTDEKGGDKKKGAPAKKGAAPAVAAAEEKAAQ